MSGQVRTASATVALPGGGSQTVTRIIGIDYAAAISLAEGFGAANAIFFELLSEIEALIVRSYRQDSDP